VIPTTSGGRLGSDEPVEIVFERASRLRRGCVSFVIDLCKRRFAPTSGGQRQVERRPARGWLRRSRKAGACSTRVEVRYGGEFVAFRDLAADAASAQFRLPFDVRLIPDAFSFRADPRSNLRPTSADIRVRVAIPARAETEAEVLAATTWPEPAEPETYPSLAELRTLREALSRVTERRRLRR
jgi:hypothetical protein